MNGKILIAIISFFTVVSMSISCSTDESTDGKEVQGDMKVGVTPTLDCLPIIIAIDRGWAMKSGMPLEIEIFQAHNDIDTTLEKSRVVAGFTDNVRLKRMNDKGQKLSYMSHDNLSWILVASGKQRLTSTTQLKDKMIAMTRLSATEQLSEKVMQEAKLNAQQTFLVPINSVSVRLNMILGNEMDAAWLPQPQAQVAIQAGNKSIGSSRNEGVNVSGVVAFPTEARKGRKVLTETDRTKFKKLYNEACDSLNKRGMAEYTTIISKRLGITEKDIKALGKQLFRHL